LLPDVSPTNISTLSLHDALPILDRILPAQLKQVAISAYERIGAASDERCEDRRVLGIARDFNRSRAQIDDFGPDVELAYELLDPDRKSTRLNSSHLVISYAVFCL